jgi:uncharacterized RDD family membrane protein YckC
MEHNPYAAPRVDVVAPDASEGELVLATKGQRFANLLLDTLGYYVFIFVIAFVAVLADPAFGITLERYSFVIGASIMLFYYVSCEALFGRTPAKLLTRTRVVTDSGTPPGFLQILGRSFVRMVPFEPFSCLGDPPVGWHDRWSGTRVVSTRRGVAAPGFRLEDDGAGAGPISLRL